MQIPKCRFGIVKEHDPESGEDKIEARGGKSVDLGIGRLEADIHGIVLLRQPACGIDEQARDIDTHDGPGLANSARKVERCFATAAANIEDVLALLNGNTFHHPMPKRRDLLVDALMAFEPTAARAVVPLFGLLGVRLIDANHFRASIERQLRRPAIVQWSDTEEASRPTLSRTARAAIGLRSRPMPSLANEARLLVSDGQA